jgi:hypothetical protein
MVNYCVLVRNLPKELQSDEALTEYFQTLYPDTFHSAIMVRDIGKLEAKVRVLARVHDCACRRPYTCVRARACARVRACVHVQCGLKGCNHRMHEAVSSEGGGGGVTW